LRRQESDETGTGLSADVICHHAALLAKAEVSLAWALVAIEAVEQSARRSSGAARENGLLRAMNLRSWFVSKMGSRPDDYVLDKRIILKWVQDGLTMTPLEAHERATVLWERIRQARDLADPVAMKAAVTDLQELRRIKRRLNVAKLLADVGELIDETNLQGWLKVREQLP
jgi:hypothetical protein